MKDITACLMRNSSASNMEACYVGIKEMLRNARMLATFHNNVVLSTGGVTSTTNRLEQTRLRDAEWVLTGVKQGMSELMEDRFEAETGAELENCVDLSGTMSWGSACEAVIATYRNTVAIGDLPLYDSVEAADGVSGDGVVCHESNDAGLPTFTGASNCALVPMLNGLY